MTTTEQRLAMYGWILIDTPELKQKYAPLRKTDEWRPAYRDDWEALHHYQEGDRFSSDSRDFYRRRIDVGEGFELVGLDEAVSVGCEATTTGGNWYSSVPQKSPRAFFCEYPQSRVLAFRRRKSSTVENGGWVAIASRLPTADEYPVWVTDGKEVHHADEAYTKLHEGACDCIREGWPKPPVGTTTRTWDRTIVMWKRKEAKPQPPAPVKSAEEIAFEKVFAECQADYLDECKADGVEPDCTERSDKRWRKIFAAGITFAKDQK